MLLAVAVVLATPLASVVTVAFWKVAEAPEVGAVNVTVAPATASPVASVRSTCSGLPKAVPTIVCCEETPVTVRDAGNPDRLTRWNTAVCSVPATDAVTEYAPGLEFAVAVTLATPLALVSAVVLERIAAGVEASGVNVTNTPASGVLPFFTVTCKGAENAEPVGVDCEAPPVAVTDTVVPRSTAAFSPS